jgi:hypothetical protein
MRQDTNVISVACESEGCGYEFKQKIGWLQARAGRADFICPNCGCGYQDYTNQLKFIRNDSSGNNYKLQLRPRLIGDRQG